MTTIRPYRESDTEEVGRLIAETYARFNLGFADADQRGLLLGPFRHAGSPDPAHRAELRRDGTAVPANEEGARQPFVMGTPTRWS